MTGRGFSRRRRTSTSPATAFGSTGCAIGSSWRCPGAAGELALDAAPGRSLPPATIRGARGWLSGYTAPVLSGTVRGTLTVGGDRIAFENAAGYHDHNWGFWKGVRWQWGQVAHGDLSIIYGRVFPPADVADPERIPGFLGVLGPQGPLGFSTAVSIEDESAADGRPGRVLVHARGRSLDVRLTFAVDRSVRTAMSMTQPGAGPALDFLQLAGEYTVTGKVGDRALNFTARGAAETSGRGERRSARRTKARRSAKTQRRRSSVRCALQTQESSLSSSCFQSS